MNYINVDPATYYEAAKIVNQAAAAFFTTYGKQLKALSRPDNTFRYHTS